MSTLLIALAGTAAAGALTWFFCIRPMRKGDDSMSCHTPGASADIEDELWNARAELRRLQKTPADPQRET